MASKRDDKRMPRDGKKKKFQKKNEMSQFDTK